MTEIDKKRLKILVPIAAVLMIFVIILGFFEEEEPEIIVFPQSTLSNSIFESQNTHYVENKSYPKVHNCRYIPYSIDTIKTDGAVIETGTAYAASDKYYFFYTEVPKDSTLSEAIRTQFSKVLDYHATDENSQIEILVSDTGFKNGFATEYQVDKLTVTTDTEVKEAHIVAYRFIISDEDEYKEKHDFGVAVVTMQLTNQDLINCKTLLDVNVQTLQYKKSLATELIDAEKRAAKEKVNSVQPVPEAEVKNDTEIGTHTETVETEDRTSDESVEVSQSVSNVSESKGVLLQKDYAAVDIIIKWTNTEEEPLLTMSDAAESFCIEPVSVEAGQAIFSLTDAKKGVYLVHVSGGSMAGTFTTEIIEK